MKGLIEAESAIVGMMWNSGIVARGGRWSYECGDRCDCLGREAVVGFVAIGAQRMRNHDERYEFDAGMKQNLDTRRWTRGNSKIEGILERERSRILSQYTVDHQVDNMAMDMGQVTRVIDTWGQEPMC